jgi:NitT/TauT family transport system substrate-binding protein
MPFLSRALSGTALVLATAAPALAQNVAVTFGTNWVAQAEHGGYYQAVADGTYAACGPPGRMVTSRPQAA